MQISQNILAPYRKSSGSLQGKTVCVKGVCDDYHIIRGLDILLLHCHSDIAGKYLLIGTSSHIFIFPEKYLMNINAIY